MVLCRLFRPARTLFRLAGDVVRVVATTVRSHAANAHAERFVRSIKEECVDRLIPFGERHFRRAVAELSRIIIANGIIKDSPTND